MRVSSQRAKRNAPGHLAELRACLHPGKYAELLHFAATTGKLATLDDMGNPTGLFDLLDSDQRIDLMKYLLNKIVPDAPRVEIHAEVDKLEISQFSTLPTAELIKIAREAEFEEIHEN
jgi:hypothetical protein